MAISQYMIGVRPTLKGLLIEPKINVEMNVTRRYRGKTIHIHLSGTTNKSVLIDNGQLEGRDDIYVEL